MFFCAVYYRSIISVQHIMLRFIGWIWKHIVIFPLDCRDKKNELLINLSPSDPIYDPKTFHHQIVSFLEKNATDNSLVSILWCMLTILPHLDVTTIIYLFGENFVRRKWRKFSRIKNFSKKAILPQNMLVYVLFYKQSPG